MVIALSSFKKAALTPKQSAYPRACCVSCSLCIRKPASHFSHTFNFRTCKFWRWCTFISAELDPVNLQFFTLLFVFFLVIYIHHWSQCNAVTWSFLHPTITAFLHWQVRVALLYYLLHKPGCIFKSDVKITMAGMPCQKKKKKKKKKGRLTTVLHIRELPRLAVWISLAESNKLPKQMNDNQKWPSYCETYEMNFHRRWKGDDGIYFGYRFWFHCLYEQNGLFGSFFHANGVFGIWFFLVHTDLNCVGEGF